MSGLAERYRGQLLEAARCARAAGVDQAAGLADTLYEHWYAPARGEIGERLGPREVVAHLRAADAAGSRFERGWTVLAPTEEATVPEPPLSSWQVPVGRAGDARWVNPIDFLYEGQAGLRPPPGAQVAVSARRDSVAEPLGWWTTFGEAWPAAAPPLVRLYWSVRPDRLFTLVEALTAGLDSGFPWALKCPLYLERCCRPDAVVLYLPVDAWPLARGPVAAVHGTSRESLASDVPALTLELAPGLGLAEDPGDESYGTQRCRIVAEGISGALAVGAPDESGLALAAEQALAAHGVSLEAPYLVSASHASYEWPER